METTTGQAPASQARLRRALVLAREQLGSTKAADTKRDDVQRFMDYAAASGRDKRYEPVRARRAAIMAALDAAGPGGMTALALRAALPPLPAWDGKGLYLDLQRLERAGAVTRAGRRGRYAVVPGAAPGAGLPPAGLAASSAITLLSYLKAAFALTVDDDLIVKNPCRRVIATGRPPAPSPHWSPAQWRAFLDASAAHRLACCLRLSAYGLRRGEVLGLAWADVDLAGRPDAPHGTIRVTHSRTLVSAAPGLPPGREVTGDPKSKRGKRELPLDETLAALLRARRKAEAGERLAAGPAWQPSRVLAEDRDGRVVPVVGLIAVDEIGRPVPVDWYSREFARAPPPPACPGSSCTTSARPRRQRWPRPGCPITSAPPGSATPAPRTPARTPLRTWPPSGRPPPRWPGWPSPRPGNSPDLGRVAREFPRFSAHILRTELAGKTVSPRVRPWPGVSRRGLPAGP